MIASRRANLKLILYLCYAILLGLGAWLAAVLLSQLSLMEPVTAAAAQSLADDDALRLGAAGYAQAGAAYASARLWVWFCIGANGAGALLFGLWLRAALIAPAAAAPRLPGLAPPRANLIERAMRGHAAPGRQAPRADRADRTTCPPRLPAPAASGAGEASARLARIARLIDSVAFQTTLLAVNAAVEAERGSRLPPRA
ncbi:hypothetical protein HF313_20595 [Massilia atriviolacea]|uniref:Methyl-accepting transducer domain-containing protein n=1 Tax=Massilia atriviolacea TaxID=2495579 RepID=A0A430HRY5_9BURK|nr:hypothetical protein [Massilia atriviolacea]RSZ60305.1 hypothetical protein EJB06_04105 [Massilia atriviolacea]